MRNPAYLLSKLAQPNSTENPKYLPLVCPLVPSAERSRLYCHYRRIPVAGTRRVQLFVYPPVDVRDWPLSYSLMGRVFASLTPRSDPWVQERSRALFRGAFDKLTARVTADRIRLLDIACGSAKTAMTLCKKAFARGGKPFDLTLVDVVRGSRSIANMFFRNLRVLENVTFRRQNLFDWADTCCANASTRFDIALMLRICDVFSRFHIERISPYEASWLLQRNGAGGFVETVGLRPDKLIAENRLDLIQHNLKRLAFKHGTAFHQFSLSLYFRAIDAVLGGESGQDEAVFIPVRYFDDNALLLPSGRSLIAQLMTLADRIVIEDADLSPRHLREHCEKFGLSTLRITDVTRYARMRGASVSVVDRRDG